MALRCGKGAIPKGLFPKLDSFRWSVSHLNPGSCEGSEPGSQIFGSDHPKNLALRGTRVGQDLAVVLWMVLWPACQRSWKALGRLAGWGVTCTRGVLEGTELCC